MLLASGAKILASHRRLFPEDRARFFVGTVDVYAEGIAKVTGFTWKSDPTHGFQRKSDRRTKLIPVSSGSLIVYELPSELSVEDLRIEQPGGHTVRISDGHKFEMDISERL